MKRLGSMKPSPPPSAVALILALAVALLAPASALAQSRGLGPEYSVLGARTVPDGLDLLTLRGGWPEASLEYTHGFGPRFDMGLRAAARFGVESTLHARGGAALSLPLRLALARGAGAVLALTAAPGLGFYAYEPVAWGLELPVGLTLELPASRTFTWGVALELRASVLVSGDGAPYTFLGPLAGPFLEWRLDRKLSLGANARLGALRSTYSAGPTHLAGETGQLGLRLELVVSQRL